MADCWVAPMVDLMVVMTVARMAVPKAQLKAVRMVERWADW